MTANAGLFGAKEKLHRRLRRASGEALIKAEPNSEHRRPENARAVIPRVGTPGLAGLRRCIEPFASARPVLTALPSSGSVHCPGAKVTPQVLRKIRGRRES